MQKYRKKPVTVEAFRYEGWDSVPDELKEKPPHESGLNLDYDGSLLVTTIHGEIAKARRGDWVIAEPEEGRFYPCKADIFEATYERVEE